MKLINANGVYYDNDFEKWYFEDNEDFENAQVVDDNYIKENQELKQQLAEKEKEIEILTKQNKALVEEEDLLDKKLKELGVDCIEDLGKSQNQKAIELLQELLEKTQTLNLMVKSGHYVNEKQVKVVFEDAIIQKISELKGKVEDD